MSKLPIEMINKILFEFKGIQTPTATIIKNVIIELNEDNGEEENQETLNSKRILLIITNNNLTNNDDEDIPYDFSNDDRDYDRYVKYCITYHNIKKDMDNDEYDINYNYKYRWSKEINYSEYSEAETDTDDEY